MTLSAAWGTTNSARRAAPWWPRPSKPTPASSTSSKCLGARSLFCFLWGWGWVSRQFDYSFGHTDSGSLLQLGVQQAWREGRHRGSRGAQGQRLPTEPQVSSKAVSVFCTVVLQGLLMFTRRVGACVAPTTPLDKIESDSAFTWNADSLFFSWAESTPLLLS